MTASFIPIARVALGEEEIAAAVQVLRSGSLVQGQVVEGFEAAFAKAVGAKHAIAVSSGTAALHIAYLAVLRPGDEVLVPAFTHISTASMVVFAGGRPVFCDIDPETLTLDPKEIERKASPRTRAVAPVHLFGNACAIDEVRAIAAKRGLRIIWDAAQAHGTTYGGRDVGAFDDLVCYSFYPTKNMTTGEGGMVTTNDGALAERCRLLRSHGQTQKYLHMMLGLNYRMTEMEAAIGLHQLSRLEDFIQARQQNAHYLAAHLSNLPGIALQQVSEGVRHAYHQFTILVDATKAGCTRDEMAQSLASKGIGTAVHYPRPLHLQPAFGDSHVKLPTSEEVSLQVLSLPVYPGLTRDDLQRIVGAVRQAVLIKDKQ